MYEIKKICHISSQERDLNYGYDKKFFISFNEVLSRDINCKECLNLVFLFQI